MDKPGEKIPLDAPLNIKGEVMPYVSRGGYKLEKALQSFDISVKDKLMIDIGSSTGGFTDCALQNGARVNIFQQLCHTAMLNKLIRDTHSFYTSIAIQYNEGPIAMRYPRGNGLGVPMDEQLKTIPIGTWEVLREGKDAAILTFGTTIPMALAAAEELSLWHAVRQFRHQSCDLETLKQNRPAWNLLAWLG